MREWLNLFENKDVPALIEWYSDGGCLTFAFAMHWMTGWDVEGVGEGDENYEHFAVIGPDGMAWDSLGPRPKQQAGESYADNPVWESVNAYKFISTAHVGEDDITEACHAAIQIFGHRLEIHIIKFPS